MKKLNTTPILGNGTHTLKWLCFPGKMHWSVNPAFVPFPLITSSDKFLRILYDISSKIINWDTTSEFARAHGERRLSDFYKKFRRSTSTIW